jgi:hypothetical protein
MVQILDDVETQKYENGCKGKVLKWKATTKCLTAMVKIDKLLY